tara:strand:+ start:1444 stop:1797 length:354 start_codon:yes stop_codon:yes gene_type:complete
MAGLLSEEQIETAKLTHKLVNQFRVIDSDMASQTIGVFLVVAMKGGEGISMQEVKESLGIAQSSVSRNINLLCKTSRHMREGHNLLITYEDPMNRRQKLCKLSPKGILFLEGLVNAM